jgi:hypothetical protein
VRPTAFGCGGWARLSDPSAEGARAGKAGAGEARVRRGGPFGFGRSRGSDNAGLKGGLRSAKRPPRAGRWRRCERGAERPREAGEAGRAPWQVEE